MTLIVLAPSSNVIPFHADTRIMEDPAERAAQSVHVAVADFVIEVQQATTADRCSAIAREIGQLVLCLQAAEDAALDKEDRL